MAEKGGQNQNLAETMKSKKFRQNNVARSYPSGDCVPAVEALLSKGAARARRFSDPALYGGRGGSGDVRLRGGWDRPCGVCSGAPPRQCQARGASGDARGGKRPSAARGPDDTGPVG